MATAYLADAIASQACDYQLGPAELEEIKKAWLKDIEDLDRLIAKKLEISFKEDPEPGLKSGYVIYLEGKPVEVCLPKKDGMIYRLRDLCQKLSTNV